MHLNFAFQRDLVDPLEVLPAEILKLLWDKSPTLETQFPEWKVGPIKKWAWAVEDERNVSVSIKGKTRTVPRRVRVHRIYVYEMLAAGRLVVYKDTTRTVRKTNMPTHYHTKGKLSTPLRPFLRSFRTFDRYPDLPKMDVDASRNAKMFYAWAIDYHLYA